MVAANGVGASAIVCLGYPLKVICYPDNAPVLLTHLVLFNVPLSPQAGELMMIDLPDLCLIFLKLRWFSLSNMYFADVHMMVPLADCVNIIRVARDAGKMTLLTY